MIKNKSIYFYLMMALLFISAAYIIYALSDVFLILIISVLLAFIFNPLIIILERLGLNRTSSTAIVLATSVLLVYFAVSFFIPKFIEQMNALLLAMQNYSLHDQIIKIETDIHKVLPFFKPGELSGKVESFISAQLVNSINLVSPLLSSIVSIITVLVIIPFILFYLLRDSSRIFHNILDIIPNRYFELSYWITKKITLQFGKYVRAWIFDAAFVGITMGLGLYVIGIPYAMPLGFIAGMGHLIPYFGPVIGGIPAAIISVIVFGDFSRIPYLILLLFITYTLDNGIVQPYIFSKNLDIHPILIILLIIAGGQLFGVLGMMLVIPAATVIKTAVKEIYFAFKNYRIARLS